MFDRVGICVPLARGSIGENKNMQKVRWIRRLFHRRVLQCFRLVRPHIVDEIPNGLFAFLQSLRLYLKACGLVDRHVTSLGCLGAAFL